MVTGQLAMCFAYSRGLKLCFALEMWSADKRVMRRDNLGYIVVQVQHSNIQDRFPVISQSGRFL